MTQKHPATKKALSKKGGRKKQHYGNENLLTSPGTVTYVGPSVPLKTEIRKIAFNETVFNNKVAKSIQECYPATLDPTLISWLDVNGIHDSKLIEKIGQIYRLHPLVMEDIVYTEHKPKLEVYEDEYVFLTLKMMHVEESQPFSLSFEHVSFVLADRRLISFQEELTGDIFEPVLTRLKASIGKTRTNGADYLLFALMDIIVDHYFICLEQLGDNLDALEEAVLSESEHLSLKDLYLLRSELTTSRRMIWPLREMIVQLMREENRFVSRDTVPYYRDLHDHVMQIVETIDSYRDLLASLADVHLSTASNRMNSVMKTLTVFSAVFMPLTFIVGVYGMNFDNMPELHFKNGYFWTWLLMGATTLGMLFYFKKKKWL
ncbi:magnesium transporter [Dyadobacter jejuensis]|uniref:Magnesium transport protein CorA n=1 Tax=Dyadobacter jejuensis TaxID=1082580 RepID=A0A316AL21_9BACT|nr:magnesium/cobalt transporter CorA [Dyadobacter jejuensis]PWJ58192.1 magnesium transporter [Dyadobacter jejuensis]